VLGRASEQTRVSRVGTCVVSGRVAGIDEQIQESRESLPCDTNEPPKLRGRHSARDREFSFIENVAAPFFPAKVSRVTDNSATRSRSASPDADRVSARPRATWRGNQGPISDRRSAGNSHRSHRPALERSLGVGISDEASATCSLLARRLIRARARARMNNDSERPARAVSRARRKGDRESVALRRSTRIKREAGDPGDPA